MMDYEEFDSSPDYKRKVMNPIECEIIRILQKKPLFSEDIRKPIKRKLGCTDAPINSALNYLQTKGIIRSKSLEKICKKVYGLDKKYRNKTGDRK